MILICDEVFEIYLLYVERILCVAGFFLNSLCVVAFLSTNVIHNYQGNMFKYLLWKSFCDLYICLRKLVLTFYINDCLDCFLKSNRVMCVINLIFLTYLGFVILLLSMLLEIALNLDRYKTITNRFKFLEKFSFNFSISMLAAFSFLIYTYIFIDFDCESVKIGNTTEIIYQTSVIENDASHIVRFFIHGLLRDGLCVLIIVALNVMTILFLNKTFSKKMKIATIACNPNSKIERSQRNFNNMILTTSLITVLGHSLSFVSYLLTLVGYSDFCFITVDNLLFHVSYSINFFVYYIFNRNFRIYFKSRFWKLVNYFTCNHSSFNETAELDSSKTVTTK
jgi:hypothetical protein